MRNITSGKFVNVFWIFNIPIWAVRGTEEGEAGDTNERERKCKTDSAVNTVSEDRQEDFEYAGGMFGPLRLWEEAGDAARRGADGKTLRKAGRCCDAIEGIMEEKRKGWKEYWGEVKNESRSWRCSRMKEGSGSIYEADIVIVKESAAIRKGRNE